MNYKDPQMVIDPENPFANCKLGREKYADALESIVSTTPDGCVIALNGEWGTGKTTFVKMWKQKLENNGFKTVYFNAWETDFVSDPLVGLIGELSKTVKGEGETEKFEKVKESGKKFLVNAFPKIASGVLRMIGFGDAVDGSKEVIEGIKALCTRELNDYEKECEVFDEFRNSLSELVETLNPKKPLVFFIDELDRCNPHYAVKLLERVKHLFSLSHIVFVLCIDKEQLGHSICGYYGSDKINAQEYLRRFIDVDCNLPEPDYDKFFDFMYSELKFDKLTLWDMNGLEHHIHQDDLNMAVRLFKYRKLSLRQMGKILTHIRLIAQTFIMEEEIHIELIILLIYLRWFHREMYQRIGDHKYEIQTLINDIEVNMPKSVLQITDDRDYVAVHRMVSAVSDLIYAYNYYSGHPQEEATLYKVVDGGGVELLFDTYIIDKETISQTFDYCRKKRRYTYDTMGDIIKHIEMLFELRPDPIEKIF